MSVARADDAHAALGDDASIRYVPIMRADRNPDRRRPHLGRVLLREHRLDATTQFVVAERATRDESGAVRRGTLERGAV